MYQGNSHIESAQPKRLDPTPPVTDSRSALIPTQQQLIRERLVKLDLELFYERIGNEGGWFTPGFFIPEPTIQLVIDNWYKIDGLESLQGLLEGYAVDSRWMVKFWWTMEQEIRPKIRRNHSNSEKGSQL
ncbi:hypothetical protein PM082_005901 [Marasmius tenuissimus]|nr:hypothetical protein PM082_005901 [Marasmius tenuissimus]